MGYKVDDSEPKSYDEEIRCDDSQKMEGVHGEWDDVTDEE